MLLANKYSSPPTKIPPLLNNSNIFIAAFIVAPRCLCLLLSCTCVCYCPGLVPCGDILLGKGANGFPESRSSQVLLWTQRFVMFPCWQEQTKGGSADVDVGVALAVQETIICISVLKLVESNPIFPLLFQLWNCCSHALPTEVRVRRPIETSRTEIDDGLMAVSRFRWPVNWKLLLKLQLISRVIREIEMVSQRGRIGLKDEASERGIAMREKQCGQG